MQNRKIRHLFVNNFAGSLYMPDELQTPENIKLLNDNLQGFGAISRFSYRESFKYWQGVNAGKTICIPSYLTR